jgi:hypothetical protein
VFVSLDVLKNVVLNDVISFQFPRTDKDSTLIEIASESGDITTSRTCDSLCGFPQKEKLDVLFNPAYDQTIELQGLHGKKKKDAIHVLLTKMISKYDMNIHLSINGQADFKTESGTISAPCTHTGEDKTVSIYGKTFIELLKGITSENLTLHFVTDAKQLAYHSANEFALINYTD